MARIKEFQGIRPVADKAHLVAELPYDVVSSEEARHIAAGNKYSFFHVSKPEIDLPAGVSLYDPVVYETGKKNLDAMLADGVIRQDAVPLLYLYTLVMNGREQTGLVTCLHIDDYINDRIKKHELTREDKEKDRMRHMDVLSTQAGLVFTFYREDGSIRSLFAEAMKAAPEYDYTAPDGIRHIFRKISDSALIDGFKQKLSPHVLYIADGHHRAASAVKLGLERRKKTGGGTEEEYNWFMAVVFPHDQLRIMAYNRVVKDLNGMSAGDFMSRINEKFNVEKTKMDVPAGSHGICMYLEKQWYLLSPRFAIPGDPIKCLDVSILQDNLLDPLLGIKDPRRDMRIDFIGGIRGTAELVKLVDGGKWAVAFSMYPTSIEELIDVADAGGLMPPKSTWFEPKLRSGLVLHGI